MLNRIDTLIANRNLPQQMNCGSPAIQADTNQFIIQVTNALNNQASILPIDPGFEEHPYKGLLQNANAKKYIIGTFPPVSYLIDSLRYNGVNIRYLKQPTPPHQTITEPTIPFFHGNVSSLWAVLLPADDLDQLRALQQNNRIAARTFLIEWLTANGIYYDDIINYTQRKLGKLDPDNDENVGYTYEDTNLKNICPDANLVQLGLNNKDLKVVCFTNGATFGGGNGGGLKLYAKGDRLGLVRTTKADALSLFLRTCQDMGLKIEMRCCPHFDWTALQHLTDIQKRTKLIFELRITKTEVCKLEALRSYTQKIFTVITPFSPAAHGTIEAHPIVLSFRATQRQLTIVQILRWIYERFRNDTYAQLYDYNINQ